LINMRRLVVPMSGKNAPMRIEAGGFFLRSIPGGTTTMSGSEIEPVPEPDVPDDLTQVRELILSSHRDIVPELVQGESVSALVSSIEPARAAYARAIESVPASITIPAGGNAPVAIDIDALPTSEKIRRGLASSKRG